MLCSFPHLIHDLNLSLLLRVYVFKAPRLLPLELHSFILGSNDMHGKNLQQRETLKTQASSPITIHALTWNLGNKEASPAVLTELSRQLTDFPTVIALSTQEELAPDNKRLQIKLLEQLNASLPEGQPRYKLVETGDPQYHTTTAGANNTVRTLMLSTLTNQNRVNTAVLIREPYELENAQARIDYEPGKEGGNKSIITIKGELRNKEAPTLSIPLAISGGHLNSNSDKKRRAHANKFLAQETVKTPHVKTFEQIYNEAAAFRILMGDMNERDYLMKDGSVQDRSQFTHYRAYGFDIDAIPEQTLSDGQRLLGTYGFKFLLGTKFQTKNIPDPRGREHMAKGGHLDRVCYSSGLQVTSKQYGARIEENFLQELNGKTFYHGSDHVYVGRRFEINPDTSKAQVVGTYIKHRLPNFEAEAKDLLTLKQCHNYGELLAATESMQYHDSTLSKSAFLSQITDLNENQIHEANFNLIHSILATKLLQKLQVIDGIEKLRSNIDNAISDNDEAYLTEVFNFITKCNQLRNDTLEVSSISSKILSEVEKKAFQQKANVFIDSMYLNVLSALCNKSTNFQQFKKQIEAFQTEIAAHLQKKPQPLYKKMLAKISHKLAKFDIKRLQAVQSSLQEKYLRGNLAKKGSEILQRFKRDPQKQPPKKTPPLSAKKTFRNR